MGKAACATCHYAPTFSGLVPPLFHENESEVLGVLAKPNTLDVDSDPGRIENQFKEDKEEIYRKSFKIMTVRNVKLTAPYFHNGNYKTLKEVVEFYNKGGAAGLGLTYEVPNQTLPPDKLHLSKKEVEALIAFMESLTDNPFATPKALH
jgi:cytochrome c peroxidase